MVASTRRWRRGKQGVAGIALAAATAAGAGLVLAVAGSTPAMASSDVFWSGTDSNHMSLNGPAPYKIPKLNRYYGGYIGMVGNWARWKGCSGSGYLAWSSANAKQANLNRSTYHKGVGVGIYWFMAGPGVDPHYNGTTKEAHAWGAAQAKRTLGVLKGHGVTYPVIFADIEIPGNAPAYSPAPDNGWNAVYTAPCSGRVRHYYVPARVDRADFNGFAAYIVGHSKYKVGVYSAPNIWRSIFGTGIYASIPNTYEWTYLADTSSLGRLPAGWCLKTTRICAHFFGGQSRSSKYALIWQWSGGGGTYNGYGDFDQIDASRTPK